MLKPPRMIKEDIENTIEEWEDDCYGAIDCLYYSLEPSEGDIMSGYEIMAGQPLDQQTSLKNDAMTSLRTPDFDHHGYYRSDREILSQMYEYYGKGMEWGIVE